MLAGPIDYICVCSDWAFNLERGEPLKQKWGTVPSGVDILVTHGPPLGRRDQGATAEVRYGCVDLLAQVQSRIKPQVHVFGHNHRGYGTSFDGTTIFINAASVDETYAPNNPPIVIDVFPQRQIIQTLSADLDRIESEHQ